MAGGDHQAAGGLELLDEHAASRRRNDVGIEHPAPAGQQTRNDGMLDHQAGRASVAGQNDGAAAEHRAQSATEIDEIRGIQPVADHTAQARNTENPLSHESVLQESKGS